MKIEEIIHAEPPRLLLLYDKGQEDIVRVVADVLGQKHGILESLSGVAACPDETVIGIDNALISDPTWLRKARRTIVTTHAIDLLELRNEDLSAICDYEYLYTSKNFARRDVARFFGFILGQIKPHDDLKKKARTTMLSTTFPDIRAALPNMNILSVGADSFELRVDLLEDPDNAGVPGLNYVGEQLMTLRQGTELPIIFTTRCVKENGRFPMEDPSLFYKYLRKAIQWGCEYIDIELWLPEDIRRRLAHEKGNSKIISAWHDFSETFRWSSPEAVQLFKDGAVYGDVVKMIAVVTTMDENYELEYFRSYLQSQRSLPPFSGLCMGQTGQLSRLLNRVFTPCTHPLLPLIAAPGQLSAAEINDRLCSMGQLPKSDMYAIGNVNSSGQTMFIEKCLNELSLPHQLRCVTRPPSGSINTFMAQPSFGGAYLNPPLPIDTPGLPKLTEAATAIGQVDTIFSRSDSRGKSFMGENATWKGIRATLTRDFVPSAYQNRPALVLASSEARASAAIFALTSLGIKTIYTIGFKVSKPALTDIRYFGGVEDLKRVEDPFTILSALPAEKSLIVSPLLKHYGNNNRISQRSGRVFVDLSNGIRGRGDSVAIADECGWSAYGIADVNAWTTVETLRLLVSILRAFVASSFADRFIRSDRMLDSTSSQSQAEGVCSPDSISAWCWMEFDAHSMSSGRMFI